MFDDFNDNDEDEDTTDSHDLMGHIDQSQPLPTNIIKTRTLSVGSLPELNTSPANASSLNSEDLVYGADELSNSAPQLFHENSDSVTASDTETLDAHYFKQDPHPTASNIQALYSFDGMQETRSGEPPHNHQASNGLLNKPPNVISFTDDSFKQYSIVLPMHSTSGAVNRSPLSKLKSGLSQVSQLIGNQNHSPHARRRKQVLEAQLSDNTMKSSLRFQNCSTNILLL